MIDTTQVIYEWLTTSGTGLYTLCATRIWWVAAPPAFDNSADAIIYHPEAEPTHPIAAVHTPTFVFKCYGGAATFASARTVYRALYDRLHNEQGAKTAGAIMMAHQLTAQALPPDPDTGWPAWMARYEIVLQ